MSAIGVVFTISRESAEANDYLILSSITPSILTMKKLMKYQVPSNFQHLEKLEKESSIYLVM